MAAGVARALDSGYLRENFRRDRVAFTREKLTAFQ